MLTNYRHAILGIYIKSSNTSPDCFSVVSEYVNFKRKVYDNVRDEDILPLTSVVPGSYIYSFNPLISMVYTKIRAAL